MRERTRAQSPDHEPSEPLAWPGNLVRLKDRPPHAVIVAMGGAGVDNAGLHAVGLSIAMPYYENERTLLACLDGFAAQCAELPAELGPAELVVVDDGSPTAASPLIAGRVFPVAVRVLRQENAGQSAATNAAVALARGEVLLLTCPDILPTPGLVRAHVDAHAQAETRVAVMGHIAYAPGVERTPFIEFLASDEGPQFAFGRIVDSEAVNPAMLYAPNLSLRRAAWDAAGGFDEVFTYGFQDTDFGYRLADTGTRLVYRDAARVHHDHPTTLPAFAARQRRVGAAYWRLLYKHPTRTTPLPQVRASLASHLPRVAQIPALLDAASQLERALLERGSLPVEVRKRLHRLYTLVLQLSLVEGMAQDSGRLEALFGGPSRVPGYSKSA